MRAVVTVKAKGDSKYPTYIKTTDCFPRRWMETRKWIQSLIAQFLCCLFQEEAIQPAIFTVVRTLLKSI